MSVVGGNCGVYKGTQVRSGAVLGAGVILTRATPVYDIVREQVYRSTPDTPLMIPANAVVVPGSRAISKGKAAEWGLSLYTPVIVKYRDDKTQGSIELDEPAAAISLRKKMTSQKGTPEKEVPAQTSGSLHE